jgi:hypothetical protein
VWCACCGTLHAARSGQPFLRGLRNPYERQGRCTQAGVRITHAEFPDVSSFVGWNYTSRCVLMVKNRHFTHDPREVVRFATLRAGRGRVEGIFLLSFPPLKRLVSPAAQADLKVCPTKRSPGGDFKNGKRVTLVGLCHPSVNRVVRALNGMHSRGRLCPCKPKSGLHGARAVPHGHGQTFP